MGETNNGTEKATDGTPAARSQARGRQRRTQLLAAAAQLLSERQLDEISLHDMAHTAGIPTGSAYHFYANAMDAYAALAGQIGGELVTLLAIPLPAETVSNWEDVVRALVVRAADFYRARPDARQLLISGKAPTDLKRADRDNDRVLAHLMREQISAVFELPRLPDEDELFFHTIEIIDLFYMLSMLRSAQVTAEMTEEASRAAIAYLRIYLPAILLRHPEPTPLQTDVDEPV